MDRVGPPGGLTAGIRVWVVWLGDRRSDIGPAGSVETLVHDVHDRPFAVDFHHVEVVEPDRAGHFDGCDVASDLVDLDLAACIGLEAPVLVERFAEDVDLFPCDAGQVIELGSIREFDLLDGSFGEGGVAGGLDLVAVDLVEPNAVVARDLLDLLGVAVGERGRLGAALLEEDDGRVADHPSPVEVDHVEVIDSVLHDDAGRGGSLLKIKDLDLASPFGGVIEALGTVGVGVERDQVAGEWADPLFAGLTPVVVGDHSPGDVLVQARGRGLDIPRVSGADILLDGLGNGGFGDGFGVGCDGLDGVGCCQLTLVGSGEGPGQGRDGDRGGEDDWGRVTVVRTVHVHSYS